MSLQTQAGSPPARPARRATRAAYRTHALRPGTRLPSIRSCASGIARQPLHGGGGLRPLIAAGADRVAPGLRLCAPRAPASWCARPCRRAPEPGTRSRCRAAAQRQRGQLPPRRRPVARELADHETVAAAVRGGGRSRGLWLLKYGAGRGLSTPARGAGYAAFAHRHRGAGRPDRHRGRDEADRPGRAPLPRARRRGVRRGPGS